MAPVEPLSADPDVHRNAKSRNPPGGWLDRDTFSRAGLYLVNKTVVDTRTLAVHALVETAGITRMQGIPPVSLSPDERSFVWFSTEGADGSPVVGVSDWTSDTSYVLPVDPTRMRFRDSDDIDPSWIAHHFVWARGSDGVDRLRVRDGFPLLPYRGSFEPRRDNGVTTYSLSSGGTALRQALTDVLVRQLGAVRKPDELEGYYLVLSIDGKTVKATAGGSAVAFSMLQGEGDPGLMARLAATLDAALATGAHDHLFVPDKL